MATTAGFRVPLGPNEVKDGLAALDTLPPAGVIVTLCFVGALEVGFGSDGYKDNLEEYCSRTYPDIATNRRKPVELNNGRAAQMGILALFH